MPLNHERLPIEDALPELRRALADGRCAVVTAPPGAGKSTLVPLALLDEPWAAGGKIVLLEPRRIAARSTAKRMAALLGERVGETVGYRTRGDTLIGSGTRIEVVTEGILTRMLQTDPSLEGIAALLFDEFHERSVHADLGLALALEARSLFRDDLRLVVMSATIEAERVAGLLGEAAVIRAQGRMFPVETHYADRPRGGDAPEPEAAKAAVAALHAHPEGDLLVFLPGGGEIRRCTAELQRLGLPPGVRIAPLYGALTAEEQDDAVAPCRPGERKIVLATDIAETSLTVEGVRIVIDAGLRRVPRFSPRTGLTRLETVPVTLASAEQRRGRAGRIAPGVCYRLWTEEEHRRLAPFGEPELLASDLASVALELAIWGAPDPAALAWLDPPPDGAFRQAMELLRQLGAVDERGIATEHGRRMADLGAHPRLAHMMLLAEADGRGDLACELAALLESRGSGAPCDMRERVEELRRGRTPEAARLQEDAARRMREAGGKLREAGRSHRDAGGRTSVQACGELLAAAFPDRVAMRRSNGKYTLVNGRGAELPADEPLARERFLVIADLDGAGVNSRIRAAAPVSGESIKRLFASDLRVEDDVYWDDASSRVTARRRTTLGALPLAESPLPTPDPERVLEALLSAVAASGLSMLPWSKAALQLLGRMRFMAKHAGADWPDVSDEALNASLGDWLGPFAVGMKSHSDLERLNVHDALLSLLSWEQRRLMDEWAPVQMTVPSGSRIAVDYSDPDAPALSVKLQELFGWTDTPRLAGGRVPLTLKLLSPAQRPVQITRDLTGFWRTAYFEIKKDLKGRYPKHYWPDNPLEAAATRGTKPKEREAGKK